MRRLASSDRSTLIRLASAMPKGNATRRAILAGLTRVAIEFDTKEALEKYMKDHPDADPKNHSVKKNEESGNGESGNKGKWENMSKNQIRDLEHDLNSVANKGVAAFMDDSDIDLEDTSDWGNSRRLDEYEDTKDAILNKNKDKGVLGYFSRHKYTSGDVEKFINETVPNFLNIDKNLRNVFQDPKNLDDFLKGLDSDIGNLQKLVKDEKSKGVMPPHHEEAVSDLEKLTKNLKKNLKKVAPKYHEAKDGIKSWREKNT